MPTRKAVKTIGFLATLTREQRALLLAVGISLGGICLMNVKRWPRLGLPRFFLRRWRVAGVEIGGEFIPDKSRLSHTRISGATGTGKSVLLEQLIFRDLERGMGAVIIDPKGERKVYDRVRKFCRSIGRETDLHLLSATHMDESVIWNPCRLGNASDLQSKFYNSAIYSEPHYAKACEEALIRVFQTLGKSSEVGFTVADVVRELGVISKHGKDQTTAGLFFDLNNLILGDWGSLLGTRPLPGAKEISFLDITRRNEIVFVDLPTETQKVQSARIGRLLLQEITLISGLRKNYPHLMPGKPFSVFIDEFDAFAVPSFVTLLNKGRSGEFMIHMAHQTLSDLEKIEPTFKGQITGNANVQFVFRLNNPDDADEQSRSFGTRRVVKRTYQSQDGQSTGMSSNREVQEFRISPDAIKDLKTGDCIFSDKMYGKLSQIRIPFSAKSALPRLKFPTQRPPGCPPSMEPEPPEVPPNLTTECASLADLVEAQKQSETKEL